jgi:hypothetical protein
LTAFDFGQTRLASRSGTILKPLEAFLIEAMQATSYRLRAATQIRGDGIHLQPIPAPGDDASAQDPVNWSVPTARKAAYLALLLLI